MQVLSHSRDLDQPESLVHRLAAQLSQHVLWDSLLIFIPPAGAFIYIMTVLFRTAWLDSIAVIFWITTIAALGILAVALRYRPLRPSVSSAARLIDQQAGAKDHFLTLATIEPGNFPPSFVARLRLQTVGLVDRVELKRDFPYKLKRSAYWSVGGSLIAALLIHFLGPFALTVAQPNAVPERLRQLAREMAVKPALKGLARDLEALAAKIENPKTAEEEKQALAQQLEKKIDEQQKKEEQKDNRDLLGQAASALEGMEQQQLSGQEGQKDQQKSGGGIQSNLPQNGEGESKQSQGGNGESKNDSSAQLSTDPQQGKNSQGNPKEPGQDKNPQQGDAKEHNQPDPSQANKEPNKEQVGKSQAGGKEGAGKEQASEQPPPSGAPPAERYYPAGEGKEGIKGARYVTVQLPEEIIDSKGESRTTRESKSGRRRSQVPVSNVPLPAHIPNAPTEKQQMPIEYRGMIR